MVPVAAFGVVQILPRPAGHCYTGRWSQQISSPVTALFGESRGQSFHAGSKRRGTGLYKGSAHEQSIEVVTDVSELAERRKAARAEVAQRIAAARALAQRLTEERSGAAADAARSLAEEAASQDNASHSELEAQAKQAVDGVMDAAEAAAEIATAQSDRGTARITLHELKKLQAENQALQNLLKQQGSGGERSAERLARLKQRYTQLTEKMESTPESSSEGSDVVTAEMQQSSDDVAQLLEALASDTRSATGRGAAGRGTRDGDNGAVDAKALRKELRAAATAAERRGAVVFAHPTDAITAGQSTQLFYNRLWGPARNGQSVSIKAGFNEWSHVVEATLRKEPQLDGLPNSDWWSCTLDAPRQLYALEFVFSDPSTSIVDNNKRKNYTLELKGATTKEAIEAEQLAAFEAAEAARLQALEEEEARLWEDQVVVADQEAEEARRRFRREQADLVAEEAKKVADERRGEPLESFVQRDSIPGVFKWVPLPTAGATSTLCYNKAHGSLREAADVVVHWGYDGWWQEDIAHMPLSKLSPLQVEELGLVEAEPLLETRQQQSRQQQQQQHGEEEQDQDWWAIDIEVPSTTATVDFVVSDSSEGTWDNNGRADFHTSVGGALSGRALLKQLISLLRAPKAQEEAQADAEASRARHRILAKAGAQRRRREVQRATLYTEPVTPQAGRSVTVYYNPSASVLRTCPEVWLRGSWNRWSHDKWITPRRMTQADPSGYLKFLKAEVEVPQDAYVMDVVFSDTGEKHGGFYDNNNGLDYHIGCTRSTVQPPPLRIVHVTVEMAPIAKVGGMGDVVTALGRAVQDEGHEVTVVMPKYDVLRYDDIVDLRRVRDFWHNGVQVSAWQGIVEELSTIFLEPQNGFFWVGCVYGRNDDASRFGWFCGAAAEYIRTSDLGPDVIHCHDWPTAPVTWSDIGGARTMFTIHNLNYGADLIGRAMASANVATTVSPTYAREVSGQPSIAPHMAKFFGIRNGIDQQIWDPEQDEFLPMNYDADSVTQGKAAAKAELRQRFGLAMEDKPLAAVVTRLTHQKGTHLIKHAAWRTLERGAQFVLLGSAPDPKVQGEFEALARDLAGQYSTQARLHFEYDEPLSHLIYAAADILLVPSMFEPCGLTQMIGMRYGSVPVVRRTGGLADTVFDLDDDCERAAAEGQIPNGFSFDGTDSNALDYALNRALTYYFDHKEDWQDLTQRIMRQDWSWDSPALDYADAYYLAMK